MIMSVSLLIIAVVSYLLGGVNGAIIMSRLVYHEDIRKSGSNNPGFTNFKRVYGLNAAAWSVMLIDILKTALPVFLSAVYMGVMYDDMWQFGAQFAGLFCMLGHCFPVWYGFKGGKAFIAGFAKIHVRGVLHGGAELSDLAVLSRLFQCVGRGARHSGGSAGDHPPLSQLCQARSRHRIQIHAVEQALRETIKTASFGGSRFFLS